MTERIHSLDTVKGIALLGVFFLHARWMHVGSGSPAEDIIGFILLNTSRLAVPLFFLTSGYLLNTKLDDLDKEGGKAYTEKFLRKIGLVYIAGTIIFILLNATALWLNQFLGLQAISSWVEMKSGSYEVLWNLLYVGKLGAGHIWFLSALFYSVLLVYLSERYGEFIKLLLLSAALHAIGIISRAYLILEQIPVPRDDALFFGLFFTAAGFYIDRENIGDKLSSNLLLAIASVTSIIYFAERAFLSLYPAHEPFFWLNYSLLTAPAAMTIFVYFLNHKEFGKETIFNKYGKNTLWIYMLHPLILGVFIGATGIISQKINVNLMNSMTLTVLITLIAYFTLSKLVLRHQYKS